MKTSIKSTMLIIGVLIVSLLLMNGTAGATSGKMAGDEKAHAIGMMEAKKMVKEEPKIEVEELEVDELEVDELMESLGLVDIDVHGILKDKKVEKKEEKKDRKDGDKR